MKILILLLYFNLSSNSINSNSNDDTDKFKLNENIFLLESIFIPGAGHLYNQHYRSAILSFFTTFSFFSSAMSFNKDNLNYALYNNIDTNAENYYRLYNDRNRYLQEKAKHNTFLFLAVISYFDSILDSYYNLNKNKDDTATFSLGFSSFKSNMKASSLMLEKDNNPPLPVYLDSKNKRSANLVFGFSYGSLFNKEFLIHLGPQMLFNFDITYKLFTYKYFSLILANHLDSQFQAYEFMDDGKNKSDDEYQIFNDFIVLGLNLKPIKSTILELGTSIYTVSSTWDSFSSRDNITNDFSQAHLGESGLLKGEYYYVKANVFFTKAINLGSKLTYIKINENNKNYEFNNASLEFVRINIFLNYIF